jgi:hypothetical protein
MKKPIAALALCLYLSTIFLTANAQTLQPTSTPNPENPSLIGLILAGAAVILFFAFVAYAGYKIIKKWTNSQPD